MKTILLSALMIFSTSAFATGIPDMNLDESYSKVVDVLLLADPADLAQFMKAGNKTTSITFEGKDVDHEIYQFTRVHCGPSNGTSPAQCLGGALLTVKIEYKRVMANRVMSATSQVALLR